MEKLEENYSATIQWHAYELRPAGSPPLSPAYRALIEEKRPQMRRMAKEYYDLDIQEGPFGIDSRPALIGAKFAEAHGVGPDYHDAVFRAYWQQARNIEDRGILASVAEAVGLEPDRFLDALTNPKYITEVNEDIEQAFQFGLSGVPASIFNNKILVVGAQPYPVFKEVAEKVLAGAGGPD